MPRVKRLRMFAGPNGSGKSTLFRSLAREHSPNGVFLGRPFVNADEMAQQWSEMGAIDLAELNLQLTTETLRAWLAQSTWAGKVTTAIPEMTVSGMELRLPRGTRPAYVTAALADFLRRELLRAQRSFSFETVMSHPSKVDFFAEARRQGYRLYLYFVATDDPELNVQRVRVRVRDGGHAVPKQKILDRFERSLALLPAAVQEADRAYLFDNSGPRHVLVAEVAGRDVVVRHLPEAAEPAWARQFLADFPRAENLTGKSQDSGRPQVDPEASDAQARRPHSP